MKRTLKIERTSDPIRQTWAVRIVIELPRRHEVIVETIGYCDTYQQAEALALVMQGCRNPALPPKPLPKRLNGRSV